MSKEILAADYITCKDGNTFKSILEIKTEEGMKQIELTPQQIQEVHAIFQDITEKHRYLGMVGVLKKQDEALKTYAQRFKNGSS